MGGWRSVAGADMMLVLAGAGLSFDCEGAAPAGAGAGAGAVGRFAYSTAVVTRAPATRAGVDVSVSYQDIGVVECRMQGSKDLELAGEASRCGAGDIGGDSRVAAVR